MLSFYLPGAIERLVAPPDSVDEYWHHYCFGKWKVRLIPVGRLALSAIAARLSARLL